MKFAIITHVNHKFHDEGILAYGPYVREMNIWGKHVDKIIISAPRSKVSDKSPIDLRYSHERIEFLKLFSFNFLSFLSSIRALLVIPINMVIIFEAMRRANHIHLRCPGNIGLLGCFVQILFPSKPKTAKYAGNWDPNATQPLSYRMQKRILSNTFLTKNISILAYGEWENQTKNVKPFFTATYTADKLNVSVNRVYDNPSSFIFVGNLSTGKQPLYALKLIKGLRDRNNSVTLKYYGDGVERKRLETYIESNNMRDYVELLGNQESQIVEEAYKKSDFLLLPSKSEGWPKVVAEAMFWGCIPVVSRVSCVPWMLNEGERGVLIDTDLDTDMNNMVALMDDSQKLEKMSRDAMSWSRRYTLNYFESEIKKLLL